MNVPQRSLRWLCSFGRKCAESRFVDRQHSATLILCDYSIGRVLVRAQKPTEFQDPGLLKAQGGPAHPVAQDYLAGWKMTGGSR
jgi:hypothetical protein